MSPHKKKIKQTKLHRFAQTRQIDKQNGITWRLKWFVMSNELCRGKPFKEPILGYVRPP